ncbi:MAG TPA: type VI secretion system membrane subunit TssM [Blastocatellia bacterium]|jgi:type VI secretion system protein ImpL|nr:type VI secretion system membrane subunit TssM [Blastocatellia bacterium]
MSHKDQLKSAVNIGGLVSLYGIASLLVVALGPQFGFGWGEQIVIIVLLLLTWPFAILINHYRKKREGRQSRDETTTAPSRAKAGRGGAGAPARAYDELARGAEDAVQWLRSTKLGAKKSGDAVYSLPWFVVAGPAGSGKTSLLLSSGLDYHALPGQRRAEQNIIRPTHDCEWRVTDSAVLLDTCGRYQSDGPDADEWAALIQTMKKYRRDRPLDGLLVAANLYKVLTSNETEIEQQAKIVRARLDDLIQHTQVKFPVYLVFTHADAIEGFDEFFPVSNASERAQVWGATIPLKESAKAHALFDVEFDYLYDALIRRRLIRLSERESSTDQLRVFDFPLRFAESRRKLGLFASTLFRPTPLKENPLMRGFYFTSSAALGASPGASAETVDEGAADEVHEAGDGIFTERLFKDVLLRDKDLAASFQSGKRHENRWRNVLIGAAAAALLFILLGLIVSFANNSALIASTRKLGHRVSENTKANTGRDLDPADPAAMQQLEDMDKLRESLVALDGRGRDWPPLYLNSLLYRFGLYSGNSLDPNLRAIYFEAVNQRFFKSTVAALENDLKTFAATSNQAKAGDGANGAAASANQQAASAEDKLGHYYDMLKAYLMLSAHADKAEPSFLVSQLKDYWKRSLPQESEAVALKQLEFYADQAGREDAPHVKADNGLVAEARAKLESYPAVNRYYKRVTTEIAEKVRAVTLDAITKRGVLEGSARVSGSFTLEGYKEMLTAIDGASKKMSEDDWVMGEGAGRGKDQTADVSKLKAMYAQQYIDEWRNFLKDIRVKDFGGPEQAIAALKELSANSSPLVKVIDEVARHTNFSGSSSSFWGKINPFSRSKSGGEVAAQIDKEFRPVINFAERKKDADLLSQYLKSLSDVRDLLNAASGDQWAQASKTLLTTNDPKGFQKSEQAVKTLLEDMRNANAAGSEAAKLLEQPLGNVRAIIVGDMREQIEKEWAEKLYATARALESGYPFKESSTEASLTDLAKFLNPVDGQLTLFFKEKLESSFEDANNQWKPKEGRLKFSDGFVTYLNNARRVRDSLFQSRGKQPDFTYVLALQPPAAGALVEIQVDGNRVDAQNSTQSFKWTGSSGAKITVSGDPSPRQFPGAWWSLFRMFEQGSPNKVGDNQYSLAWKVGATTVQARLQPPSPVNNPFDLKLFRDLRAPQSTR